jgi:hypothetical protein
MEGETMNAIELLLWIVELLIDDTTVTLGPVIDPDG